MATWYLDLENGNDANNGLSFANRKKTLQSIAAAGWAAGDDVRIMSSPLPTDSGIDITVTNQSSTATLSAAITKDIDDCDTGWVGAANVTVTQNATRLRQGAASTNAVIALAFTTGLIVYKDLGSSQDFSAYQQVCFWIRANDNETAGTFTVRLCSDAAGATTVNTIAVPAISNSAWQRVVVDNTAALGNSIRSVALYAEIDPGSVTVNIDNIFASKAPGSVDELTLFSLLGTNDDSPTDDDQWLPIRAVVGTTIALDGTADDLLSGIRSGTYPLDTKTTGLYLRQIPRLTGAITYSTAPSGNTAASPITIEGGWNRTDMSTKVGRSYYSRTARETSLVSFTAPHGIVLKSIAACYMNDNFVTSNAAGFLIGSASAYSFSIEDCLAISCFQGFRVTNGDWFKAKDVSCIFCVNGFYFGSGTIGNNVPPILIRFRNMWGVGTSGNAFDFSSSNETNERLFFVEIEGGFSAYWGNILDESNTGIGRYTLRNVETKYNQGNEFDTQGIITLWRYTSDLTAFGSYSLMRGGKIIKGANTFEGYNHRSNWGSVAFFTATDQRRTASGYSWKQTAGSTSFNYDRNTYRIAQVVCKANEARNVSIWARFDGTDLNCRLIVFGGRYSGVPSNVTDTTSGSINTWEQLSISFTPTEDCVVDVFVQARKNTVATRNWWFDDLEAT